jgi:hypothetical protein
MNQYHGKYLAGKKDNGAQAFELDTELLQSDFLLNHPAGPAQSASLGIV